MNIGVFFGSRNPEHDVSIITGEFIISELRKLGHNVVPVYISKEGYWYISDEIGFLKFFRSAKLNFKDYGKLYLDLEHSQGKLVFKKKGFFPKQYNVDLAFPAFHGAYGEDGTIQGMFEIFDVPYVGCGVVSSAIAMDKVLTKLFYQRFQIPTTDFLYFDIEDWGKEKQKILQDCASRLGWPVFVKPATLGSSIGIARVENNGDLEMAIEVAFKYCRMVLVEKTVQNLKDLTCAVIGNSNPRPSLIQQSAFKDQLFSYADKYLNEGGAQLGNAASNIIIPADVPEKITKEIRELSVKIFKLFRCSGTARVDFLYDDKEQKYYANEINTLPGTLYHHLWKASRLEMSALLGELIDLAVEKHKDKSNFISSFQSDILRYANSAKLKIKGDG